MKIILLSYEYPPETGFGGIGTYTWHHARALVKLGHDVHVLAGSREPTPLTRSVHDGVKVFRYRGSGFLMDGIRQLNRVRLWWSQNRLENALSMYRAFKTLRRLHSYDVVEMPECGGEGLFINNLTKTRTVVRFHSPSKLIMPYYDVRPSDITVCSFLEQLGLSKGIAFTSCSGFLATEAANKLGISKPIKVIPNGIDLELFDSEPEIDIHEKFQIPRGRPVILFSGRMEKRKGIHLCKEIVPAILERYEADFVFVGQDLFHYMSDTLLPYWKSKKFKGSFYYLGRMDQAMIRAFFRQADIFLLPSLWENCPYSCLEAMASCCAIVSTDQGGMRELIQDETNGLLAQNGDVNSYVSCLEKLLEDRRLREALGAEARRTVERSFTDVRIARLSEEYYAGCGMSKTEQQLETSVSVGI